jgi:hypothetical protein
MHDMFAISMALLRGTVAGQIQAESTGRVATSVTRYPSVFHMEVINLRESPWDDGNPQRRTVTVRARATRILKNGGQLAPGDFTADLVQARRQGSRVAGSEYFWSDHHLLRQ